MTSIKDVAREAGVAISTVSKVLNNYPNVSDETRSRVEEAAEKLHFVPNAAAAALSSKQASRLALIINPSEKFGIGDEINMQYLSGAILSARKLGLDVITLFSGMTEERTPEQLQQYLLAQSITGIVIFSLNKEQKNLQELIRSELFYSVTVDAPFINARNSCVSIDNAKAQYDVALRMISENNASKILYLAGAPNGYVTDERLEGMEKLAAEKSLSMVVADGRFSERTARILTGKLAMDRDAVVCASDMMAMGAMRKLTEMDIFKPVCGFDGLSLMGYAGKHMYTVRQGFENIASEAVRECNRLMNGGEGRKIILPHEVVRMEYEDVIR